MSLVIRAVVFLTLLGVFVALQLDPRAMPKLGEAHGPVSATSAARSASTATKVGGSVLEEFTARGTLATQVAQREPSQEPSSSSVSSPTPSSAAPSMLSSSLLVVDDEKRVAEVREDLNRLKECWSTTSCGFSNDFSEADPRAAHFEAVRRIRALLRSLDSLTSDSTGPAVSDVACEWMTFPDDHVRESALVILEKMPASQQNLRALLDGLSESHSGPLYKRSLNLLKTYADAGYENEVSSFLASTLAGGGIRAAESVAEGIFPFLNKANHHRFETVRDRLPPGSRAERDLRKSLAEFKNSSIGG